MTTYTITSKAGMPPYSTATTRAAAEADSREARQLGLDGEIIEEPTQKSYQQITGDATTDRAVGGDTAPASPSHTPEHSPEPWRCYNSDGPRTFKSWRILDKRSLCVAKLEQMPGGESEYANAARICACVNACAGMTDPEAEIKALRDALENFCRQVEFTKYDFPPEILPEHKGSAIHVAWEAARTALKGATK
jgi:hypothetical protein